MTTTLSITETRQRLLNLIRDIHGALERVVITKNGKPEAVLMSYEEFQGWLETLEISQDTELMHAIKEGIADIAAGRVTPAEEVLANLSKKKIRKRAK